MADDIMMPGAPRFGMGAVSPSRIMAVPAVKEKEEHIQIPVAGTTGASSQ